MAFKSNDETEPPIPEGPARRPLSSTSVRLAPRPRREIVDVPRPPFSTNTLVIAEVTCGAPAATVVVCNKEATSLMPRAAAASVRITSIGAALVNVSLRIREPVATISSIASSSATA